MGLDVSKIQFSDEEFARFDEKLERSLEALEQVLSRPGFGVGPASIGAELELHLVDAAGLPAPINRAVLARAVDPRVTLEIDRFNLEINARPQPLAGLPFTALAEDLASALASVRRAAAELGARAVPIGILPTLDEGHLASSAITDGNRYRALSAGLRRLRGQPFPFRIEGRDAVDLAADDIAFEGACTSFQVHLRAAPADYAATYDAAQLATAPVLALAANAPLFLGKRLWDETRIALFRQAVDDRPDALEGDWRPARVSFGHGWVRRGALELFREAVALHGPLLPVLGPEDPLVVARAGGVPELAELRLHNGTVWRWNRPVYDASSGGHLRVELRAFAAGPTVRDMVANAAFAIGLTLALAPRMERLTSRITFGHARRNFYACAREGLDAELLWPTDAGRSPVPTPVRALAPRLLADARAALVDAGVAAPEAEAWLAIVEARLRRDLTGSGWLRAAFERQPPTQPWQASARAVLERYARLSEQGEPLAAWPDP